jgi:amino acid adenylation domain-containing protein
VNTLPLRIDVSGDPTFRELLGRMRETCLAGYSHQDAPFEQVVAAVQPDRDPAAHTPLFRHTLVLHDAPHPTLRLPGLQIEVAPLYTDTAKFELRLELTPEASGGLRGVAEYSSELFGQDSVNRMMTALRCLLADAVAAPDRPVRRLQVLPDAERRLLVSESSGALAEPAAGACVHQLFERQARRSPSAIAVTDGSRQLSYGEVDGHANQLARYLGEQGAGPEDLVAVCLPRGVGHLITLLAVLKAGAGFVALDPADPPARRRHLLRDCGARLAVSRPGVIEPGEAGEGDAASAITLIDLEAAMRAAAARPARSPETPVHPASRAYACYTSGSTGTPKGVMIDHAALANLVAWRQDKFALGPADVALSRTPLGFDVSIGEWAWPLAAGARVVLANHEESKDPRYLVELIRAERVTVCSVVPSLLRALLGEPAVGGCADSLKLVMCGGELLTADLAARFAEVLPGVRLVNLYGPTEATIDVTTWPVGPGPGTAERVPIGTPIAGTRIYVLDEQLEPVPVGVPGELYIGGIQLSRGYLSRPGLTADRFGPDPFVPGARLYRTGDKVRWLDDGVADFVGRVDDQLKIRGHRVEPAEIEAVLASHPDVTGCAVIAGPDGEGTLRLAGYLTARDGADPGAMTEPLRGYLRARLPDYMIPATLTIVADWPVGPNGKLDRAALVSYDTGPRTGTAGPRTPTEQRLARIWCDVLKLSEAGVHDDFFELGGHSLLAARLVARVRAEFGVDLPLGSLLRSPTIATVAATLDAAQPPLPSIPRVPRVARPADGATGAHRPRERA